MNDISTGQIVREHNKKAAAMWGGPGRSYNQVSRDIAGAIEHCVNRLAPAADQHVLDLATGTGWASRRIAADGARVTGVDIAEELLAAARELAKEANLEIDYRLGDAESLPFPDESFDAVISTFGVMFAPEQETAITELARVCKPGGRLAVAAWLPDSTPVKQRQLMAPFMPPPPADAPAPPSPFNWGDRHWLATALGPYFDLACEADVVKIRYPTADDVWRAYAANFGPMKAIAESLDGAHRSELQEVFTDWLAQFQTDLGIAWPCEYLVTLGTRK